MLGDKEREVVCSEFPSYLQMQTRRLESEEGFPQFASHRQM